MKIWYYDCNDSKKSQDVCIIHAITIFVQLDYYSYSDDFAMFVPKPIGTV